MVAVWTSWHNSNITAWTQPHKKKTDIFVMSLCRCSHYWHKRLSFMSLCRLCGLGSLGLTQQLFASKVAQRNCLIVWSNSDNSVSCCVNCQNIFAIWFCCSRCCCCWYCCCSKLDRNRVFSLPQIQLLRIDQFGAMLVSENNDYGRNRAGDLKPALIINSPYYYGGVPRGTNVSVFEVQSTCTLYLLT